MVSTNRLEQLTRERERKLQRIGDKVADRKFLSPTAGSFLLDEIERLEAVIRRAGTRTDR